MRAYKTEGIVIKRKNFGEADRIITIFTKKHGKIQVKATGVRRITSRRSSHIELLNYGIFNLHRGRSLPVLTEVQSLETFYKLKNNLAKIGYAYHVCELVDGLCAENQESFEIFMLLGRTLRRISLESNLKEIVRDFELNLLRLLGFYTASQNLNFNTQNFIENILERKLKSKQILLQLS